MVEVGEPKFIRIGRGTWHLPKCAVCRKQLRGAQINYCSTQCRREARRIRDALLAHTTKHPND